MRFIELKLQNFGVYRGTHTFDLQPRNGNIVIFGGKNGAGKTTLLEAIQLCLYGVRALGNRVGRRVYDEYIVSRMHRKRGDTASIQCAAVTLRFEYAQSGKLTQYEVTREWEKKTNGVTEQLSIRQDEQLITELAEKRWQDFIEDTVPPGTANLFFFDGEKIQSLAADGQNEQSLGNEIKQLLNLDLVERLQADLDIYMYRQRSKNTSDELTKQLDAMQHFRAEAESRYQSRRQDRAQTQAYIDHANGQIEKKERQISRESSGFASERADLKRDLDRTELELKQIKLEIQDMASGLLPFALVPELSQQLKKQLLAEARFQQWQASRNIMQSRIRETQATYRSVKFWEQFNDKVDSDDQDTIARQFDEMLAAMLRPPDTVEKTSLLHQVSEPDRFRLLSWIERAETNIPQQAQRVGQRLDEMTRQRKKIALQLRQVPEDDVLKPLMTALNEQYQKLGELEAQAEHQDQELRLLEFQRQEAQRKLKKAYDSLRAGEAVEQKLKMVIAVQDVLDQFQERLTREKLIKLEHLVAARFNDLIRKPDLVKEVHIDAKDFQITLVSQDKEPVPKSRLSAGEKQIFAIAMLWALRQLSGCPFPIVIDTPLGRLDSDHRANLVAGYFPYVSHQVILFSTDTEVDQTYFESLRPHISHAYHLVYDPDEGATLVHEGYFFEH